MISPDTIENAYPCTAMQRGMLYHCLESGCSDVYITYITLDIHGALDVPRFQSAWTLVAQQHESLRSSFQWDGLDEPVQVIHRKADFPWSHDLGAQTKKHDRQHVISEAVARERLDILDPTRVPLMRFRLFQHSEHEWTLLWSIHHLLADGWSTPIILGDVLKHYDSLQKGQAMSPGPGFVFAEHAAWLQTQDSHQATRYWQQALEGMTATPLRLPVPFRPAATDNGNIPQCGHVYPKTLTQALTAHCRQSRLTLGSFVHGAWALLLREYCDCQKVLFGTSVSGRQSVVPGVENAVGLFLNTLPLAIDMPDDAVLRDWLNRVQSSIQSNQEFQSTSLSDIQAMCPGLGGEQPFESIVVVESHPNDLKLTSQSSSIAFSNIDYLTHSHFPLALLVFPGAELKLTLVYDESRFHADHIRELFDRLLWLMEYMKEHADSTLLELSNELTRGSVLREQTAGKTSTALEYHQVHHWLDAAMVKNGPRNAVVCGERVATYQQLADRSNQIANLLIEKGFGQHDLIGVGLARSIDQIATLLAILKLGAAYVPFDPNHPADRQSQMIVDSGLSVMVFSKGLMAAMVPGLSAWVQVEEADGCSLSAPAVRGNDGSQLAYLMYTSGSTGTAKGVRITHENLVYSTKVRIEFYQLDAPCYLLLSSITFDSSVAGIYGTLCSGGTLVLPEPDQEKDVECLAELVLKHQVTHTLCLPALYHLLLNCAFPKNLASLQTVIVAGENCTLPVVRQHFSMPGSTRLFNEYGPTEACVWATVHEICAEQDFPIPIGKPIGDTLVMILNTRQRPCLPGVEGELCIGGRGVADGYHANNDMTRERFVKNNISAEKWPILYRTGDLAYRTGRGDLIFRGRLDRQAKIRGHRIEPVEIESVIMEHPDIAEAVVVARSVSIADKQETIEPETLARRLRIMPESTREDILGSVERLAPEQVQHELAEYSS